MACQSSTSCTVLSTIQMPPLTRSFSTICPRLTLNTGWLSFWCDGIRWATAGLPSQERAYVPGAPPQAACTQSPSTTGRAGVPAAPLYSVTALSPCNGTLISDDEFATYTASAFAPDCCRTASLPATPAGSGIVLPPGSNTTPLFASRITGVSPTAVNASLAKPAAVCRIVTSVCKLADAAKMVPSSATARSAPAPTVVSGLAEESSAAMPDTSLSDTRAPHSLPVAGSLTAAVPPESATTSLPEADTACVSTTLPSTTSTG